MKKMFPVLLVLCLLLYPVEYVFAHNGETLPPCVSLTTLPDPLPPLAGEPGCAQTMAEPIEFEPGSVPAAAAPMDAISLPIHALVLSMLEQDLAYDDRSDLFVWNALYYTLSMYGSIDERASLTTQALILPSEAVQDYLSALFDTRDMLPPVPSELNTRIHYDPLTDHYLLALGDFGLDSIRIDNVNYEADGICAMNGALVTLDNDTVLCIFTATLVPNDSMFGFSVLDLTIL